MLQAAAVSMGLVANTATSLPEARMKLAKGAFDFVILDAMMQDTNGQGAGGQDAGGHDTAGQDLAMEIKNGKYGQARLLLLAPVGYRSTSKMQADGWLTKPVRTLLLHNILVGLLSREYHQEVYRRRLGPMIWCPGGRGYETAAASHSDGGGQPG